MTTFTLHDESSAPNDSKPVLAKPFEKFAWDKKQKAA